MGVLLRETGVHESGEKNIFLEKKCFGTVHCVVVGGETRAHVPGGENIFLSNKCFAFFCPKK